MVDAALAAGRSARAKAEAQQADLIILPDSFYGMNTWNLDGTLESTRYRWRDGIKEKLRGMINDALAEVRQILEEEGLLIQNAA
jgi:hypothetical protein